MADATAGSRERENSTMLIIPIILPHLTFLSCTKRLKVRAIDELALVDTSSSSAFLDRECSRLLSACGEYSGEHLNVLPGSLRQ